MAFGCLRALGIMTRRFYSGVAGERVMATLRTRIADRYRQLALAYHRETPTGELLAHMEADVKAAVDVFWPVPFATGVIVLVALAMIQLLEADIYLAMVAIVLFPALALMNQSFAKRMEVPARRAQERIGEVSAVAHESIDGALVVKTLGREEAEIERLSVKARALRDDRVEAGFIRATFEAALDALPALAAALLLAGRLVAGVGRGDHARRADRVRRVVRSPRVADAVHRLDPGGAAASGGGVRPARGGLRGAGDRAARGGPGADARRPARSGGRGRHARVRRHARPGRGVAPDRRRGNPWRSWAQTGGGQVHARPAPRPSGRPGSRHGPHRRRRPPPRRAGIAPAGGLDRVPGELPVLHDHRREHRARLGGGPTRRSNAPRGSRRSTGSSARCPPGSTRWSASAATRCRVANASASRWRAPSCASRAC